MTNKLLSVVAAGLVAAVASAQSPVMRVNGVDVARNELEAAKRVLAGQLGGGKVDPAVLDLGAVEQIVGRMLLAQAARDAKVTLEPGTVAKTMEEQRSQAGGQEKYAKALAEVGLSEKDVERVMSETLLVHRYVQTELAPKVVVAEADAKKYYDEHPKEFDRPEEVRLRMILLEVKPDADEATGAAAKAKAEKALERINKGEDFAKVAAEVSDDPTKARGGEVGWVPRGRLIRDIEPVVFGLANGATTSVLKTRYGYNLFKVEDRHAPRKATFDEVKSQLEQALKARQVQMLVRDRVNTLKAQAKVEYLDPTLKAAVDAAVAKAAASQATAAKTPGGK